MSDFPTKIEKLRKGMGSVPRRIIDLCLDKGYDLIVTYNTQIMTITYRQIKDGSIFTKRMQVSKKTGNVYEMMDFKFISDKNNKKEVQDTLL